jgi:8-oxo-dGTP diphosphatase
VGVILNAGGEVLVSRRHAHLHQGGLWEFPGGKIHVGETVQEALRRELEEELAIVVTDAAPLIDIEHSYPDRRVRLEVWTVSGYTGEPAHQDGQPIDWLRPEAMDPARFPAANLPIIHALLKAG